MWKSTQGSRSWPETKTIDTYWEAERRWFSNESGLWSTLWLFKFSSASFRPIKAYVANCDQWCQQDIIFRENWENAWKFVEVIRWKSLLIFWILTIIFSWTWINEQPRNNGSRHKLCNTCNCPAKIRVKFCPDKFLSSSDTFNLYILAMLRRFASSKAKAAQKLATPYKKIALLGDE